jgi:type III secretion protein V
MSKKGHSLPVSSWYPRFKAQADVILALTVITVVALLVVPIPTFLIDIFICANIAAALVVLLLSIYIPDSLKLSSFPTILLLATLFRLGLNVATSRLILLHADAGEVVTAFGNTVVGGNLVVGVVIFLLLMLINMLVVAKGSERVAEVAARFTLDAMPGKQMSIDADLRAGIIDMDQAKAKRISLSQESQLFGAMDGAMKFVKGDVIAGVIIFFINIIAGVVIGKFEHHMEIEEALTTFAILSVGDGLVSIIPGLLMSVCAGLIVTRVESTNKASNLGSDVLEQILAYPKAMLLAAIFIMALAVLPGLPTLPFAILALLVGGLGLVALKNNGLPPDSQSPTSAYDDEEAVPAKLPLGNGTQKTIGVVPITIEVASNLVPLVDDKSNFISELIPLLRESLEGELGIEFPGIRVRPGPLREGHYNLLLNEIPCDSGMVEPHLCLVTAQVHELLSLGIKDGVRAKNPVTGLWGSLAPATHRRLLEKSGYSVWDAPSRILLHLSVLLRKSARDFVTVHETQVLLDRLEAQCPALVKEVIPKAVSLFQLTDVLRRLLNEEVPVKDLKTIMQALAEHGPQGHNTILLTEYVRMALARFLCYQHGNGANTLIVYLLDPEIEDMIRSSIEHHNHGSFLSLEPDISEEILRAVKKELDQLPPRATPPVILTAQDIRRFVRKLLEQEFFSVAALSFQELSPEYKVQPIGRISLSSKEELYNQEEYDVPPLDPFQQPALVH